MNKILEHRKENGLIRIIKKIFRAYDIVDGPQKWVEQVEWREHSRMKKEYKDVKVQGVFRKAYGQVGRACRYRLMSGVLPHPSETWGVLEQAAKSLENWDNTYLEYFDNSFLSD